jgi:hypothetical protein
MSDYIDTNKEMLIVMFVLIFAIISLYFYNQETFDIDINDQYLQSPLKYMGTMEFNKMVAVIKKIVYQDMINYAKVCASMNGVDGPETNQLTIQCITDPASIHQEIVENIADFVINHVKEHHKINLNPYQVVGDFMVNLGLLDFVINPLLYSNLYTVNGLQYFTKNMLAQKVNGNLKIRDVLYTTLSRRGIDVIIDSDGQ